MAISLFGEVHVPAVDNDNSPEGPSITLTPPSSMLQGDFVLVSLVYRGAVTWTNSTTGGQTWSSSANTQSGTTNTARLFWCVYNGTWDADPVFTVTTGTAGCSAWMAVFRGVDPSSPWDVTPVIAAQSSSTTFVIADYSTNTNNAWAIVGASSQDNNTWTVDNTFVAPSGSGNVYWRSSAGTDNSLVMCRKLIATAGAVGATTMTQATLGDDLGTKWYGALKSGLSRWLTETATVTDTVSAGPGAISKTETSTLTDTIIKATGTAILAAVTLTDVLVVGPGKVLTETAVLTDTLGIPQSKLLTETAVLSHNVLNLAGIILYESATLTDSTVSATKEKAFNGTETATLADTVVFEKALARTFSETATLADTVQRDAVLILTESVSLADTFSSGKTISLTETVTLSGSVLRDPTLILVERIDLGDPSSLNTGLVAYYALEETSGARADEIGALDLSDNNTVGYDTGKNGQGASFVKLNEENLSHADDPVFKITSSGKTLAFWVKLSTPSQESVLLGKQSISDEYSLYCSYGTVYAWILDSGVGQSAPSVSGLNDTNWHLVCLVYDPATKRAGLSVDGATLTWGDALGSGPKAGADVFRVGGRSDYEEMSLDGVIDELAIYSRTLSNAEIAYLYNSGTGKFYPFSTLKKEVGKTLTETLTLSDTLSTGNIVNVQETVTLTATVELGAGRELTETATLADQVVKKDTGRALTETLTLADVKSADVARALTDAVTLTDSITIAGKADLIETLVLSDTLTRGPQRTLTETAVLADARTAGTGRALSETATLTDTLTLRVTAGRTLTEGITLADQLSIGNTLSLAQSLTLTDTLARTVAAARTLTETLTLADSPQRGVGRTVLETTTLTGTQTLGQAAVRTLTETLTLTGTLTVGSGKQASPVESVTLTDVLLVGWAAQRTFVETATLTDSRAAAPDKTLPETVTLADSVSFGVTAGRIFTETLILADTVSTQTLDSVTLSETLSLTDTLTLTRTAYAWPLSALNVRAAVYLFGTG